MQWQHCEVCNWSVPVETRWCEVCTALIANPHQQLTDEARVIVQQMHRSIGVRPMEQRYQAARQARIESETTTWWNMFLAINNTREGTSTTPP
jgi:hypothetical protein